MTEQSLRDNLLLIRRRIEDACARSGRDTDSVRIMAVTKTHPASYVSMAVGAGMRLLGENRVQEAAAKFPEVEGNYELHLIGHLQGNKAKTAAELFSCVQSIDSPKTAAALNKHAGARGKKMDILVEVNVSGEESKFGVTPGSASDDLLDRCLSFSNLELRGLMTIGPFVEDEKKIRACFAELRRIFERSRESGKMPARFDTLSMGMSGDYVIAVEEGSTLVRIGTALFGERSHS